MLRRVLITLELVHTALDLELVLYDTAQDLELVLYETYARVRV